MALYKNANFLKHADGNAFDLVNALKPGQICQHSGIYRCTGCGDEIASNKGNPMPPQNHHQHVPQTVPIKWQLIVAAVQQ